MLRKSLCSLIAAGSWHRFCHWYHGLCTRRIISYSSTSFPCLIFFFATLPWGSMIHKHTGRWISQGCALSYLGTERNVPVFQNWFQPCQSCCHLCYPGEYLRLGCLVRYNCAQILEASDCLKLLSVYVLTSLMSLVLSSTWSSRHWSPYRRLWRLCRDAQLIFQFFFLSFSAIDVISKVEIGDCSASTVDSAFVIF